jgi:serine/threonine-protein kinase
MVAIKVFAGELDLPDARTRFSREARVAASLNHPNIVTVYDFGEYESQPYIVMEYVAGETLAAYIRRKTLVTMSDKARWMEELCAGANYAHQMQLVHRDIKPANLIIDRVGRLKILDFGIARMLGLASNTSVMIGTPGYMAPEQIIGNDIDHRADQFSIGVVSYELLAQTEAFPGDTLPMITHRILNEEPVPLAVLAPDAPPELVTIIERTLNKNPADRFADTETLRAAIARVRRDASNQAWNAPTIISGRDPAPSPPTGARGTGSSRRRQDDAIGVAQLTPPPEPRRTDREALARRRTVQLEAALNEARSLLAQGRLEQALDACQLALTFDENHVGALRLEEEIETALRYQRESPAPARLETLWPGLAVTASEAATRLDSREPEGFPAPASPNVEETVLRLPAAAANPPGVAPSRKTPPPVPSPTNTPVPVSPLRQPAARVAGEPELRSRQSGSVEKTAVPAPPVPKRAERRSTSSIIVQAEQILAAARRTAAAVVADRRALGIVAVSAVVVVAAVVAALMLSGPVPTGTLVIDAAPWGTIEAIETEDGESVALPASASTPLSMTLPTGTYQVVVVGPPPELQPQRISVHVATGGATVAPLIRFQTMTPEEYFEQYLSSPTSPSLEAETAPSSVAPVNNP